MRDVVIAGYLRTGLSRSRLKDPERDWFYKMPAQELMANVMVELVNRVNIEPAEIDDFLVGCGLAVGEQYTLGGRFPIFLANFPCTIPAKCFDETCGSGHAALNTGYLEVASGAADIVMAGGFEHMTRVPLTMVGGGRSEIVHNKRLYEDENLKHWEIKDVLNMGITAEKLYGKTDFTKEDMDRWSVRSHHRAAKAEKEGFFSGEIVPIAVEQDDGTTLMVDRDQSIREDATYEELSQLKSVFKADGGITAGNASPLNAGSSAIILMTKETARKKGIKPLATIRSIGFAGVDPTIMGEGPIPASKRALKMAGLKAADIDYWEINEAFAIVVLNCIKNFNIDPERVNIKGGGISIGHPLGVTGPRMVGTLARILQEKQARYGLANMCCGGGQGTATIIEREDYDW